MLYQNSFKNHPRVFSPHEKRSLIGLVLRNSGVMHSQSVKLFILAVICACILVGYIGWQFFGSAVSVALLLFLTVPLGYVLTIKFIEHLTLDQINTLLYSEKLDELIPAEKKTSILQRGLFTLAAICFFVMCFSIITLVL